MLLKKPGEKIDMSSELARRPFLASGLQKHLQRLKTQK